MEKNVIVTNLKKTQDFQPSLYGVFYGDVYKGALYVTTLKELISIRDSYKKEEKKKRITINIRKI